MYWRRSVKGVAVAKPSAAALSKVAKPNGDLNCDLNGELNFYEKRESGTELPNRPYLEQELMLSLQMTEPEVSDLLLWCCCTTWVVDAVEDPEIGTVDAGFKDTEKCTTTWYDIYENFSCKIVKLYNSVSFGAGSESLLHLKIIVLK